MDIHAGNKLIAEFTEERISVNRYDLKYHSSWDWLMPVVKKIQQIRTPYFNKKKPVMDALMDALMDVEVKSLWEAVVIFIQWYNTNQSINQPNNK